MCLAIVCTRLGDRPRTAMQNSPVTANVSCVSLGCTRTRHTPTHPIIALTSSDSRKVYVRADGQVGGCTQCTATHGDTRRRNRRKGGS